MRRSLRATALVLAAGIFSSCASTQYRPVTNPIVVPKFKEPPAVSYIPGRAFIKMGRLPKDVVNRRLIVNFAGGTISDFARWCSARGIEVSYDAGAAGARIPPINGEMTVRELMDKVAFLANLYWTGRGNAVRFLSDRIVVYQFPLLSEGQYKALFDFGDDDSVLESFKETFFKELKDEIDNVINYSLKGKVSVSGTVEQTSEGENASKLDLQHTKEKKVSSEASRESTNKEFSQNTESGGTSSSRSKKAQTEAKEPLAASSSDESKNSRSYQRSGEDSSTVSSKRKDAYAGDRKTVNQQTKTAKTTYKEQITQTVELERELGQKGKVAVLPQLGELIVRVTPDEEKRVDSLVRSLAQEVLSKMVVIRVYAVEVTKESSRNFSLLFNALKRAYRHEANVQLDNQLQVDLTSLATDYISGIAHGVSLSATLQYLLNYEGGRIVTSSTLFALPRTMARISSMTNIPYVVPERIVSQSDINQPYVYTVKWAKDGIAVRVIPTVLEDGTIVLSLGMLDDQYLGEKTVQAGNAGTVTLPIQAPRKLNTTVRCRPGDVVFVGGVRRYRDSQSKASNFGIPTGNSASSHYSELYILLQPRLILFKENH